jgi:hypothetical protein
VMTPGGDGGASFLAEVAVAEEGAWGVDVVVAGDGGAADVDVEAPGGGERDAAESGGEAHATVLARWRQVPLRLECAMCIFM